MATQKQLIPAKTAAQMVRRATAAVVKAKDAQAKAHIKAFAARMIVAIAKAAGISPPPMRVRKAAMARGRKQATAVRKRVQARAAAARARAQRTRAGR